MAHSESRAVTRDREQEKEEEVSQAERAVSRGTAPAIAKLRWLCVPGAQTLQYLDGADWVSVPYIDATSGPPQPGKPDA